MLYTYDKDNLNYKNVTKNWILIVIGSVILLTGIISVILLHQMNNVKFISEETKNIILRENDKANEFTPERLRAYILELNIKFPHIVYAQAVQETGHFTSDIFRVNKNLMGMKRATSRPTTNKGEEFGHARYDSWKASIEDYAFFQAAYLNTIKTEDEYFEYLRQNYAEDPLYVDKLKKIIAETNNIVVTSDKITDEDFAKHCDSVIAKEQKDDIGYIKSLMELNN